MGQNKLIIDFETRSRVELKNCGVYTYAEDPSTDIICAAVKMNDEPADLWISKPFLRMLRPDTRTEGRAWQIPLINDERLQQLIEKAHEVHAHNAQFERVMWYHVMHKRYGFPQIPLEKWRCTAAKASYFALPRSLGEAGDALNLPQKKDKTGYRTMLKLCKPNSEGRWHEDPADFLTLFYYCVQDVETEYELDRTLLDLPAEELEMYRLDQKINDRGITVDIDAIENLIYKVQEKERRMLLETQAITKGVIKSVKQVDATIEWMKTRGVIVEDLTKGTVKEVIGGSLPPDVKRILEIRQSLAKASVAKLDAMKRWACKDGRVRGSLLFYGANTGRWAGKGIQPQNYPRESFEDETIKKVLYSGIKEVDAEFGDVMHAVSKCLRGMLTAAPGKTLLCQDFSAIEARVLAWFASEHDVIKAYERKEDLYVIEAAKTFKKKEAEITKPERLIGKVQTLALGYQGWIGAFESMAANYGLDLKDYAGLEQARIEAASKKQKLDPDFEKEILERPIKEIIIKWREAHPRICAFWKGVEEAAILAVKTGKPYEYGRIKYGIRGRWLHCKLPSGRLLSYCDPGTKIIKTKYGVEKEVISFMGMHPITNKWDLCHTYGGKLTENIVQATARDLLREALFRLEKRGFNTVLHVHDEILADEPDGSRLEEFRKTIAEVPVWAKGCPMDADGWSGFRYRKN